MEPPDSNRFLVLDSDSQAGLSIVRSLGRRGVPVTAGSSRRLSLGCLSRYCDAHYVYPDPDMNAGAFVDHLVRYLEEIDHAAVIPVVDRTSILLSKHKDEIERTDTTVAVEDWDTFERAYDKAHLFELAEQLSVPTPETYAPTSPEAVEEIAPDVPYPSVVKPRSKTVVDDSGCCHYTLIDDDHYVESPAELIETYRSMLERCPYLRTHPPLVQEYIEGTTTTTVGLADEGEVLAYFQEERIRTYPASGGNSTLLTGLHEPDMLEHAREVIDSLGWTGPAMVEFMRTPGGEFYLIEVNGRYWGSLPFAIESGVEIPWLHYQQLCDLEIDTPRSYRIGFLQQRLLFGDVKWLFERFGDGDVSALPRFLWACLSARQTFVSVEDPLPTLGALCQTVDLTAQALVDKLLHAYRDTDHAPRNPR